MFSRQHCGSGQGIATGAAQGARSSAGALREVRLRPRVAVSPRKSVPAAPLRREKLGQALHFLSDVRFIPGIALRYSGVL